MAAKSTEGADAATEKGDANARPAGGGGKGGIMGWLPLIVAILLMPVLAYAVTTFVLLPKLQKGLGITPPAPAAAAESEGHGGGEGGHGGEAAAEKKEEAPAGHGGGHGGGEAGAVKGRSQAPLNKLMVNVAGTSASRILMASLIMVSATPDFAGTVKAHEAQLRDTACGILGTKTITDLVEKPGARNLLRSELITAFNGVLGGSTVQEIYFTDFAIQ